MSLTSKAEGGGREGIVERMRQTFGLNYTNADALYGAWQKNPNMSSGEMQALIDKYKNEPPPANSAELSAAKTVEEIKNLMTQTGQIYWDGQIAKLIDELRKAEQEYEETKQGAKPENITPNMTPVEIERAKQRDLARALKYGNSDDAARALIELEKAQMDVLNPAPSITDWDSINTLQARSGAALGGIFSPGLFFRSDEQKRDAEQSGAIQATLNSAIISNDAGQMQAAKDVLDMFSAIPRDVRKDWDKNNTANGLSSAADINELKALLRELIQIEIDNGRMTVRFDEDGGIV
jgi:hypothetical protein